MRRGKRDAVIGANALGQAKFLERALEDGKGEGFLGGGQRFTGEEVPARKIGDRQRIAVPPIPELELAFVVGAPERIRLRRARELGARGARPTAAPTFHEVTAIEDRVDGADGRQVRAGELLAEL